MKKLKSFLAVFFFAVLVCASCFAAGSTKIVSHDGKTKMDIVGTWICKSGEWTTTLVLNKNGTFTYLVVSKYDYMRSTPGDDGKPTTKIYSKGNGTYKIVDGNILQRNYTYWWSNVHGSENSPGTSRKELLILGPDQFLMGEQLTFTRKK